MQKLVSGENISETLDTLIGNKSYKEIVDSVGQGK